MGLAFAHRFGGGVTDVGGRVEVGLAETEVEHGLAVGLQLPRLGAGRQGCGRLHGGGHFRDG
jgi:hypothetical protein